MTQTPSVGRVVHYVSYGTPGGEYVRECRAAVVTAVYEDDCGLAVLNPSGLFFNTAVQDENDHAGGTWHWPERVVEVHDGRGQTIARYATGANGAI